MAVRAADAGCNHLDDGAVRTLATRLGAVLEHERGVRAILDDDVLSGAYETELSVHRSIRMQFFGREAVATARKSGVP